MLGLNTDRAMYIWAHKLVLTRRSRLNEPVLHRKLSLSVQVYSPFDGTQQTLHNIRVPVTHTYIIHYASKTRKRKRMPQFFFLFFFWSEHAFLCPYLPSLRCLHDDVKTATAKKFRDARGQSEPSSITSVRSAILQ